MSDASKDDAALHPEKSKDGEDVKEAVQAKGAAATRKKPLVHMEKRSWRRRGG